MARYEPEKMSQARLNLHYGLQIPASVSVLADPKKDFSHTSFFLNDVEQTLIGQPIINSDILVGLKLTTLEVKVYKNKQETDSYCLVGHSLEEGFSWLQKQLKKNNVNVDSLSFPKYPDFPEHALSNGKKFEDFNPEFQSLADGFSLAQKRINAVLAKHSLNVTIRTWPHHFDSAALVLLKEQSFVKDASVGIGFSPGDSSSPSPYYYVSVWPYPPKDATLPTLKSKGRWHSEHWTGAVLTEWQNPEVIEEFISEAYPLACAILRK